MVLRPQAGASFSEPSATCTRAPSCTTENISEPQTPQRVWLFSGSPTIISRSAPRVIPSCSRAMPANGLNAAPVDARQREQWQLLAYSNASATS